MSAQEQALKLATETLPELFKDAPNTASILRRCLTISTLLGRTENEGWIREELVGFHQKCTFEELKKTAPNYRFIKVIFKDRMGRVVIFPSKLALILHDDFVSQSIGEVEDSLENGLTVLGGELLDIAKEVAKKNAIADIAVEYIDSLALKKIVEQVRNKALEFVNVVIKEQSQHKIETVAQKPDIIIINDEQTEDARLLLYSLENELRQFVMQEINRISGKISDSIKGSWESARRKEFLPPRQPLECELINYSSFDELKKIIVQDENWEKTFKNYFGRRDGFISRLNELDDIRDTIAHNRILSSFDFNSFKTLYGQITGCIEKPRK